MTVTSHDNSSDAAGSSRELGPREPQRRQPRTTRYRVISRILLALKLPR